jgi:hypothetical protein
MDDRRFDALARSLASGSNRRQLLKGLLGIGGAVAASAVAPDVEAARRPTPTPRPVSCPGIQIPCGADCCCPAGHSKCGPDCCPDGQAECCDNACCYGTCHGEELCCPNGSRLCDGVCLSNDRCCTADDCSTGVCATVQCTSDHTCLYTEDCTLGGAEACCFEGQVCLENGACCTPTCNGASCGGDDGCGGTCPCPDDKICNQGSCVCPAATMLCPDGVCRPCCEYDNQSDECASTQGGDASCWACFGPDGPGTPARACGPWTGGCIVNGVGGTCGEDHICHPNPA